MTKGHPLKGCLFYFPNFFIFGNMKTIRGGTRSQLHGRVLPGVPLFGKWEKIRGGTRSQLRRPLFPLGLPLVGHAEKHVIKRGICGNFEGACEVVQLANTHFQGW